MCTIFWIRARCNSLSQQVPCIPGHNNLICSQIRCLKFFFSSLVLQPLMCLGLTDDCTPQFPISFFVQHTFTSKILWSFDTETRHLNLGLPFCLLISGWENFIFIQDTLSSIPALCPNPFNLAFLIIFPMLNSFRSYTVHHYSLFSIPLGHKLDNKFSLKIFHSDMLSLPSSLFMIVQL